MIDYHGIRLTGKDCAERATYEREECSLALHLFDAGDRVLVAGVGMGLVAACIASTGADLIGVEAQASLVRLVRENVRVDGLALRIVHGALALSDGERTTIGPPAGEDWALARLGLGDEEVESVSIERLLRRHRANAVALDVEGTEALLARAALPRVDKALIEVHRFIIGRSGEAHLHHVIREAGHIVDDVVRRDNRVSYLATSRALRARNESRRQRAAVDTHS